MRGMRAFSTCPVPQNLSGLEAPYYHSFRGSCGPSGVVDHVGYDQQRHLLKTRPKRLIVGEVVLTITPPTRQRVQ